MLAWQFFPKKLIAQLHFLLFDKSDSSVATRSAGSAFFIRIFSAALIYVSQIVLARLLGQSEFGIYVFVWTCVILCGDLLHMGMGYAAQRYIPEYNQAHDKSKLRGFFLFSQAYVLLCSLLFCAAFFVLIHLFRDHIGHAFYLPLLVACFIVPFFSLINLYDGVSRSYDWIYLALTPPYFLRPLIILIIMIALAFFNFSLTALETIYAALFSTLVTVVIHYIFLKRKLAVVHELGPSSFDVRKWISTTFPIFLTLGFYSVLSYADVLILNFFMPSSEVGVYFAATKTLSLVAFVYFSVGSTVAHKFAHHYFGGEREELAKTITLSIKWTFWPSLAAILFILIIGKFVLSLFGQSFVSGYPLLAVLSIGLLARASVGPAERLLNMLGQQKVCAAVYAVVAAVNVAACLILIPLFGPMGAAISVSLSIVCESILLFWLIKTRLGFHAFIFGGGSS